jgi:flagellar protein FliS
MTTNPSYRYLENQVNSASPGELVIMLYDGLVNFSNKAVDILTKKEDDYARLAAETIDRCIKIITALNNALLVDASPEFSKGLSNIYIFFVREFSRTISTHNPETIKNIIPMIEELRDGWKEAEQKLHQEANTGSSS